MSEDGFMTLKLPAAYDGLVINMHNRTSVEEMRIQQNKAELVDGKWVVNVLLRNAKPDLHLTDNRPGA